ncbi:alpha/beta hydrolase fold protein [Fonsecaea pedrosoi]|nr:alpha/beta hydrolase fold protein [Fonsecaea pedrosoi]
MATYETAEDKFVTIHGIKHAYRRFGQTSGTPLFLHVHFRGNMDWWDPVFVNDLAARRPILLVDNTGVGRSEGEVGTTFAAWAQTIIDVAAALEIPKLDVLGFSMGGFVAQRMALQAPSLVRRLVVAGAGPSAGEGIVGGDPKHFTEVASASTPAESNLGLMHTFFSPSAAKQALAASWIERMEKSRAHRAPLLDAAGTSRQIAAVQRWFSGEFRDEGAFDQLDRLAATPTLVANGSNDLLVPTENSIVLWRRLTAGGCDASLHLYPDSGHGFLDEYNTHFARLVNDFLDE